MKIAFDGSIFFSQKYGGISRYFYELINVFLRTENIEIHSPFYINEYLKNIESHKIKGRYVELYPTLNILLRPLVSLTSAKRILKINPDIIHHTYYDNIYLSSSKSIRIVTIHDLIHEKYPQYFSKLDRTSYFKAKAIKEADHIITVSNNTKNDLEDIYQVDPERISVIKLGVSKSKLVNEINLNIEKPFILYVGKRDGYKNFDLLLKVFGKNKYLHDNFIIIAFGGEQIRSKDSEAIKKYNLDDSNIKFITGNDKILHNLYQQALLLVYPSLYEGFGLPPLEAMQYGCLVLSSKNGSMPEILDKYAIYFDPEDPKSLENILLEVICAPHKFNHLIESGIMHSSTYTWENCASQTLNLYRKLV